MTRAYRPEVPHRKTCMQNAGNTALEVCSVGVISSWQTRGERCHPRVGTRGGAAAILATIAFALMPTTSRAAPATASHDRVVPTRDSPASVRLNRRFLVGLEAVAMQMPALRPRIAHLDPRYIGESSTLAGVGVFARWRVRPIVGLELGVRSGSFRVRDVHAKGKDESLSYDVVMADIGTLLYLVRGEVGHFALDAGAGGIYNLVRYGLEGAGEGRQRFGSGFLRVGVGAEILTKRIAFVLSLRSYGVMTAPGETHTSGRAFEGTSESDRRAPVAALQTYVVGSAGIAYRF